MEWPEAGSAGEEDCPACGKPSGYSHDWSNYSKPLQCRSCGVALELEYIDATRADEPNEYLQLITAR